MIVTLQGYVCPWNEEPMDPDCGYGAMAPNSLHISGARDITMRYGSHDHLRPFASTARRTLSFFNDAYGCGFIARVDSDAPGVLDMLHAVGRGDVWGASWGAPSYDDLSIANNRVQFARFDHFALTADPNFRGSGCWRADQPWNQLQPWLRDMRATFANTIIERTRAWSPSSSPRVSPSARVERGAGFPKASPPASLVALMGTDSWRAGWRRSQAASRRYFRDHPEVSFSDLVFRNGFGSVPDSVSEWLADHEAGRHVPKLPKPMPADALDVYEAALANRGVAA